MLERFGVAHLDFDLTFCGCGRISAPITDEEFLAKLDRREYLIGACDALDVIVRVRQRYAEDLELYVNDPSTFVVVKVLNSIPRRVDYQC